MELSPEEYDPETGLPLDKGYLECYLPPYVQEAIDQMQKTWARLDAGEKYMDWDWDWCNLQSNINSAEVNGEISSEQAWYLREKYLRIERRSDEII